MNWPLYIPKGGHITQVAKNEGHWYQGHQKFEQEREKNKASKGWLGNTIAQRLLVHITFFRDNRNEKYMVIP